MSTIISSSEKHPAAGTIVYSRSGEKAEYVAHTKDGHLIKEAVTYYSPDPDIGEGVSFERPAFWHEVFLKPPVTELHEEVAALNAQVEKLQSEVSAIRAERRSLDTDMAARKARIVQHEQLAQLDDYIAGKITHFVIQDMGYSREVCREVRIVSFKDVINPKDQWGSRDRAKLLVLFGDSKGNLTWGINDYHREHASSTDTVIPCCSEERAKQVAAQLLTEQWAAWFKDRTAKGTRCAEGLIADSEKLSFPVPQEARDHVAAKRLAELQGAVTRAEEDLAKARAALASGSVVNGPVAPRSN